MAVAGAAWAPPLLAVELNGQFTQGGLVQGRAAPGAQVLLDGRAVRVAADGAFVFGFGRDAPPSAKLEIRHRDGKVEKRAIAVAQRRYDIQRVDGLPPEQVTPPPTALERIAADNAKVAAARAVDSPEPWYRRGWLRPAEGPISGVYGSQRILNGEPRQPHFGLDFAAPEGAPVIAASDGLVRLAEDLYFTGLTVVIDHGFGLTSTYSHLKDVAVRAGQAVKQGDRVGAVGATGRASGPHLDWRVNWFEQRLDPALLLPR
jgi:murein DD-endopeptidase MepM/ murein hydrolase activator NlpD